MPASRAKNSVCGVGCKPHAKAAQRSTAATEPQVPGPGLPKPAPKNVATVQAHLVQFPLWTSAGAGEGLFVMRVSGEAAQVFEDFGVEDGGADLVNAHGHLPRSILRQRSLQKREVLVFHLHEHSAGGAV